MYIELSEIMRLKGRLSDVKTSIIDTLNGVSDELLSVNNNINSRELVGSNGEISNKIGDLKSELDRNLDAVITFLATQIDNYQGTNDSAKESLEELVALINGTFSQDGKLVVPQQASGSVPSVYSDSGESSNNVPSSSDNLQNGYNATNIPGISSDFQESLSDAGVAATTVAGATTAMYDTNTDVSTSPTSNGTGADISIYNNKPECGFVVTTDNQTYSLNDSDRDLIYSIVAAESDKSYDDSLAVASVILNRCESPAWIASFGTNPVSQATARNQFVVYQQGNYKKYTNGNAPEAVKRAVDDALNGVRNCSYLSFRSNGTTSYSSNLITSSGNRYK